VDGLVPVECEDNAAAAEVKGLAHHELSSSIQVYSLCGNAHLNLNLQRLR